MFHNSLTTNTKSLPAEMAETLYGFWSLTSLGPTVDLAGKSRTAKSKDELQFPGTFFSPGKIENIKVVNLYNQAVKVGSSSNFMFKVFVFQLNKISVQNEDLSVCLWFKDKDLKADDILFRIRQTDRSVEFYIFDSL